MNFSKLNPKCDRKCRFVVRPGGSTLIGWTQEYNKNGKPLHKNPNTTTSYVQCMECHKTWTVKSREGEEDEITP